MDLRTRATCVRKDVIIYFANSKNESLQFSIFASKNTPLVNIPLVVKDWGTSNVGLVLDGSKIQRGKRFRYGYRDNLDGTTDLLVFIKHQSQEQTEVELIRISE